MSEDSILWVFAAAAFCVVVAMVLYMLGGRRDKWRRRFGGSAVLASTNVATSLWFGIFNPWFLLPFPIFAASWSQPYGSESFWTKLGLRILMELSSVAAGLPYAIMLGGKAWWIFAYSLIVSLAGVILALKNPVHAPVEEGALCLGRGIGFILYPFYAA